MDFFDGWAVFPPHHGTRYLRVVVTDGRAIDA
jgi:hypothetical protein